MIQSQLELFPDERGVCDACDPFDRTDCVRYGCLYGHHSGPQEPTSGRHRAPAIICIEVEPARLSGEISGPTPYVPVSRCDQLVTVYTFDRPGYKSQRVIAHCDACSWEVVGRSVPAAEAKAQSHAAAFLMLHPDLAEPTNGSEAP